MTSENKPTARSETSKTSGAARLHKAIFSRLREGKRVRRTLPSWGRVHIDRHVPFLCVYRRMPAFDHLDMQFLVTSEAAYLYVDSDKQLASDTRQLVDGIAEVMVEQFGAFLILEIWPAQFDDEKEQVQQLAVSRPRFRLVTQRHQELDEFMDKFVESLSRIKIDGQLAEVDVVSRSRVAPPKIVPLLSEEDAVQKNCLVLGLEVSPVYADLESGEVFPQVRRSLERQLSIALKRIFYQFARTRTTHRPPHYHSLGRRATVKAVWRADKMLAEVSDTFDFLLHVSPINATAAWRQFQKKKFQSPPSFRYRPLPVDPILLKRQLYDTPLERVEDPAIGQLLRAKLIELDRQIGMLLDINTPQFVHGSVQLYGGVESSLLATAESILERFPGNTKTKSSDSLNAIEFANRAKEEIEYFREQDENVRAKVEIRDDINGLVVSHGSLLVSTETNIPSDRVEAMLQHEVGTHVLTYYNGRGQPFRQLSSGLSGYESLQEGIAVLAEFLVGGLNANRMRLLAARVIAVRMMLEGATFVECFHKLVDTYGFLPRAAFSLTMRIFRGGGLTKDAIYLRGLVQTLNYLGKGGELEPLFIGKISAEHIAMMKELRWRQVLSEPKLTPRYMTDPAALARLEEVRSGMDVLDLVGPSRPRGRGDRTAKRTVTKTK